jgi:hypothetical protein
MVLTDLNYLPNRWGLYFFKSRGRLEHGNQFWTVIR